MIRLKNFKKKYKEKEIISCDDVTFEENKISFIMAPNGTGKTTLLKCIFNLEGYEGTIIEDEADVDANSLSKIVLWDDSPFYTNLTGFANLRVFSGKTKKDEEILRSSLKYLDEDTLKRKVKNYSYGQKKKLGLILTDIMKPRIIAMDEITNGLDYDSILLLKKHLATIKSGKTIIITGHQLPIYDDIIDNLFVIKDRKICQVEKGNKRLEEVYHEVFSGD
ncbi:MAG: ATP-binding cassette domain-containing protein [Acetatifactor sp.]|nr:ATP-binding cassette domain-containing protein [Acetatifactor sp.]